MGSSQLLTWHSYFRWLILLAMLVQILWIYIHHKKRTTFTGRHLFILILFTCIYDMQLCIGWVLYLQSPIVDSFWNNVALGVKQRDLRFFGLEHMTMMSLAIVLLNFCTFKSWKKLREPGVFTYLWKRYWIIYLMILSSIPWSFSPLTARPNFR